MENQLVKLAETTLIILEKKYWDKISLKDVLKNTTSLSDKTRNKISNKKYLLTNINKYFDSQIKKSSDRIDQSNRKDMFFEVLMMRFDSLQKYRRAILSIFDSFKKKPQELIFLLPSFIDSIVFMANLSNISINGFRGNVKIKGLLIVYFSSFLVWKNDNNESLEKTMTSLDVYLDRADKFLKIF